MHDVALRDLSFRSCSLCACQYISIKKFVFFLIFIILLIQRIFGPIMEVKSSSSINIEVSVKLSTKQ